MFIKERLAIPALLLLGIGLLLLGWVDIAPPQVKYATGDWNQKQLARLSSGQNQPFSFAVLGDPQSSSALFTHHLAQIRQDGDFDFIVSVGDQVASARRSEFDHFFRLVDNIADRPLLTVKGNHDDSPDHLYEQYCGTPYYSFPYKGSYFIVLDDSDLSGVDDTQWQWLRRELSNARDYRSRLIFMHAPLFDPRDPSIEKNDHGLPEAEGRRLLSLFKEYHVDHVFSGHIHSYYDGEWDGVPYTISGGGGGHLVGKNPEHSFYHFLRVRVADNGAVEVVPQRLPMAEIPVVEFLASKAWAKLNGIVQMLGSDGFLMATMALAPADHSTH